MFFFSFLLHIVLVLGPADKKTSIKRHLDWEERAKLPDNWCVCPVHRTTKAPQRSYGKK